MISKSNISFETSVLPEQFKAAGHQPYDKLPAVRKLIAAPHCALYSFIDRITGVQLSDPEKMMIAESVRYKKLRKRQYFLQAGDICKYAGFIIKGSMRMFSVNNRGQESIVAFGLENCWMGDWESFEGSCCSDFHIEATEDTELLMMTFAQMNQLLACIPAITAMFRNFQSEQLIYSQKRINAALSMNAEERYLDLLKCKPEYGQRFPQNMLACYLGVKPETLSRIRKRN